MKRVIIIIFAAGLVGLFAWLAINRTGLSLAPSSRQSAKTVIPSVDGAGNDTAGTMDEAAAYDESKTQPLIVINPDETFIQALNVDLNKDGTSDQICAIKKISETVICFVPAIQNPVTGEYARLQEIRTGITQTRTLLFYTMDIIGDRNDALVFSGMTTDNMQSLGVYLPSTGKDGKTTFTPAADLRADGSITIQEIQRSDAYNLGLTNGDSYPIVTYNSDPDSPQTLNQIERVYRWDKNLKRYEQTSQSKIEGKKIESRLVSQLQGGDVNSFEKFLSGVWYMPNQSGKGDTKAIYFDPEEQEIVFHSGMTEEAFVRESGSSRRYGAYLITHNRTIPNIRRFIDIELSGLDEISIRIQEDVKLKIGVASDWDGTYRKKTDNAAAPKSGSEQAIDSLKKYLQTSPGEWTANDGSSLAITGDAYRLNIASGAESGLYALLTIQNQTVIQMKSGKKSHFFVAVIDPSRNLILTEVSVTIDGTNLAGPPPIPFVRKR